MRHAAVEVDLYSIEPEGEATADSVEDTISEIEGQILDQVVAECLAQGAKLDFDR